MKFFQVFLHYDCIKLQDGHSLSVKKLLPKAKNQYLYFSYKFQYLSLRSFNFGDKIKIKVMKDEFTYNSHI